MAEFTTRYRMECENFSCEVFECPVKGLVSVVLDGTEHVFTRKEFEALCDLRWRLKWISPEDLEAARQRAEKPAEVTP